VNVAVSPVEQLSATDAVPKAAAICAAVGLHATAVLAVTVITGASVSRVKVIVCVCVPVLPHASVTVHVLVIERAQPVPVSCAISESCRKASRAVVSNRSSSQRQQRFAHLLDYNRD
jgi:hypothetical protein